MKPSRPEDTEGNNRLADGCDVPSQPPACPPPQGRASMTMGLLWLLFLMVLVAVTVALVYTAHHAAWAQAGDKDPVVASVQQAKDFDEVRGKVNCVGENCRHRLRARGAAP